MLDQVAQIILLLAAVQSLFLTLVFFRRYRQLYANRFLIGLLLAAAAILANLYWAETHSMYRNSGLNIMLIGGSLLIGPLQYLYTIFLLEPLRRFHRKDWLHWLPLLLYFFLTLPVLFLSFTELELAQVQHSYKGIPWRFVIFDWLLTLVNLSYSLAALWRLRRFQQGLPHMVSSLEKIRLQWLYYLSWLSVVAWIIFAVENVIFIISALPGYGFVVSSSLSGVFIYLLGYWGLMKSDWLQQPNVTKSMQELSDAEKASLSSTTEQIEQRYQKSGLSPDRARQIHRDLIALMENEKPFLDSDLTLAGMAEKLSVSTHNLSEVLNTQVGLTFFDFINQYRIDEVKKQLLDPNKMEAKILAIAFDAGFSSKTSFNTLFKKHTGSTPSDFRDKKPH